MMYDEETIPMIRGTLRRVSAKLQAGADEARDMFNALSLGPIDLPEPGAVRANVRASAAKAREAIEMLAKIECLVSKGQAPRPRKRAA
jgi:hypothetical protein